MRQCRVSHIHCIIKFQDYLRDDRHTDAYSECVLNQGEDARDPGRVGLRPFVEEASLILSQRQRAKEGSDTSKQIVAQ